MAGLIQPLRHRSFAFLWSGQTISRFGDSIYRVALAWWVLEQTGSAAAMGTVLICSFLPTVILLLVGGVVVDRLPRSLVMLASDLLRGLLVALIALLGLAGALALWHIYAISVLFGFADAFFQPAYTAVIPEITPPEALPGANALTTLSAQLTGVVGPLIAAALIAAGGTATAFAVDSATFFLSALCLLAVLRAAGQRPTTVRKGVLGDLKEGLQTVRSSQWLWATILIAALANITMMGPIGAALPLLVKTALHADVDTLGAIYTSMALGSVAAAVLLGQRGQLRHRGLMAYLAWLVAGAALIPLSLTSTHGIIYASTFIGGAGITIFGLIWTNTLQELVPREQLGRVASIDLLGSFALVPVGYGVAGWLADQIGPALVFQLGGIATALLVAAGLLLPQVRELD